MSLVETKEFLDSVGEQFSLYPSLYDAVHVYWDHEHVRVTWEEYVDLCWEVKLYESYCECWYY